MNKKFLSAILFGALMATSAGTFVSCKDYDDDIKDLQTQIDSNKNAIAELQKLVGAGNWVTSVAASGENLVVTMSNGTSTTIAGIKGADGVDGKNAAEWTIDEDGYWYKDGEKTANLAVAQNGEDGKPGATAPSPSISANGNWVVYSWDAAKGEFVAEETEIPAAGTSAYVVLKNGVYTLNIADETGKFVEVSLPATAESFTVNGIANDNLEVVFTYGEWKTPTTKADKEAFDKLAAKFPELKEYKDKQLVEQGGKLPFIVSPANVELTKEHTFALVDLKGKDAGATLSNPTMGMPEGVDYYTKDDVTSLQSRAAEGSAVWSVDFAPAKNKKGNGYENPSNYAYSLVISGPKGVIAATPYVYSYSINPSAGLSLQSDGVKKYYNEDGFDIFAKTPDTDERAYELNPVVLKGVYILEVKDPADAEKYGITIDGSVVTVASMPKGQSISVEMTMTAVAVSGHVKVQPFTLNVVDDIAATGALADMEVVLAGNYNKNGKFVDANQQIFWSLDELELSALQMKNFVAATKTLVIKDADKTDLNVDSNSDGGAYTGVKVYAADMKTEVGTDGDYTKAAYVGTTIDVSNVKVIPGDYTVVLTANDGNGTILKAESNLTLVNPEEDLLPIKEAFLNEDGAVVAAALNNSNTYNFNLANIFDAKAGTTVASYKDMDNDYDATTYTWWWAVDYTQDLVIVDAAAIIAAGTAEWNTEVKNEGVVDYNNKNYEFNVYEVGKTPVDQERTIKVTYNLFGNEKNQLEKEIQVKWSSAIYAEDASDVISMTASKLKIKFDDVASTTTVNERVVNLKAITTAVYAAGAKKGQEYSLFSTAGTSGNYKYVNKVATKTDGSVEYVVSSANSYLALRASDMFMLGYTAADIAKAEAGEIFYMKIADFRTMWTTAEEFCEKTEVDGVTYYYPLYSSSTKHLSGDAKTYYDMFTYYFSKIKFENYTTVTHTTSSKKNRAGEIKFVQYRYVNETDAAYFSTGLPTATTMVLVGENDEEETELANLSYYDCEYGLQLMAKTSNKIDSSTLVEGKKVVPMQLIITDVWGKTMTYEFEVEISL